MLLSMEPSPVCERFATFRSNFQATGQNRPKRLQAMNGSHFPAMDPVRLGAERRTGVLRIPYRCVWSCTMWRLCVKQTVGGGHPAEPGARAEICGAGPERGTVPEMDRRRKKKPPLIWGGMRGGRGLGACLDLDCEVDTAVLRKTCANSPGLCVWIMVPFQITD